VVVGAGTAGLVAAIGCAGLGGRVALIERHLLGGDCLNYGCVPSKCLIRSARSAGEIANADRTCAKVSGGVEIDFPAAMNRLRRLRTFISAHDSVERLCDAGVDVFFGQGQFSDGQNIEVAGQTLEFSRALIATGGRAVDPPIDGLAEAGYHTNETIFSLTERPGHLGVIGAGPIGCELSQAFRRLGSEVTVFQNTSRIMPPEHADAAAIVQEQFKRDGVTVITDARVERVTIDDAGRRVIHATTPDGPIDTTVDELLVGVGRAPNVEGMGLARAGVEFDVRKGVTVDDRLRTTNRRIFAAGDCCSKYRFTHTADAAARIVLQNALFRGRRRFSKLVIPWCTYTTPEVAHVGMYPGQANRDGIRVNTFREDLIDVDRAITDGQTDGFVEITLRAGSDEILGATIVAEHAGEMISEITTAMVGGIGLGTLANVIHPYPTQAEAIRHIADRYNRTRLKPWMKKLLTRFLRWRR
jgi:pyruvate/2-oxoglutarate dehydrogenase complex dihydrolipoamide dehydrogenase (E3) component